MKKLFWILLSLLILSGFIAMFLFVYKSLSYIMNEDHTDSHVYSMYALISIFSYVLSIPIMKRLEVNKFYAFIAILRYASILPFILILIFIILVLLGTPIFLLVTKQ